MQSQWQATDKLSTQNTCMQFQVKPPTQKHRFHVKHFRGQHETGTMLVLQ